MKKMFFTLTVLSVSICLSAQTVVTTFAKYGYKKKIQYTMSKGEFDEYHDQADIVEIGSVLFNTQTNEIVGFIEQDSVNISSVTPAMTIDPLCEKYYWISPYSFCLNNPIRYIDPDGRSTRVAQNEDGTYSVIGGDLKDKDLNIYVYTQDKNGNYTVKGNSIGITSSSTSFYNDTKGADGQELGWMGTINPKDNTGKEFLNNMFHNTPTMDNYMANAGNNEPYDFKSNNQGERQGIEREQYYYRGMPIATQDGVTMYTSARDIGNISAGYVAASNGMTWQATRIAFDAYQSKQHGLGIEGLSSRNAQAVGYNIGYRTNSPIQQHRNLTNSINSGLKRLWNWMTK